MTPKEHVLEALARSGDGELPVSIFTQSATYGIMDRIGVSWPAAHTDPDAMCRLGSAQADLFGFESVRAPFCVTPEAERLGCTVDLGTDRRGPMVRSSPFHLDPFSGECSDPAELMSASEFPEGGRLSVIREAARLMSGSHPDHPVIIGAMAPMTIMTMLFGAESMVLGSMMQRDAIRRWVTRLYPMVRSYVDALADDGADIILLNEGSATPDVISPDMFMDLTGNDMTVTMSGFRNPWVLHICGSVEPILGDMASTGADGLSFEGSVDPSLARERAPDTALVGNVGPIDPLLTGGPDDVRRAAKRSADAGVDIIAPGCGVPPATTDANLQALRNWNMG